MYVPRGFYVPLSAGGSAADDRRYTPTSTTDQAASQAQRWEVILRLRQLFLTRPEAGLQLLDEAVRRGGPESDVVLLAAREAAQSSDSATLLRGLIAMLARLDRWREAFELSRRLLRCADASRDDLIQAARLASHCGLKDQARSYLIRAGVPGVEPGSKHNGGEEPSDELGP